MNHFPRNKYTIKYDLESKKFSMWNADGNLVGEDTNGRELGRDAWRQDAEEVCYDYDLGLDEKIPLIPWFKKYKQQPQ